MAYKLGEEKKDYILMARARLLECMVENTKLEEEIEDPAWVAHLALEAAKEAVELARRTENRRLLVARAHLARADHLQHFPGKSRRRPRSLRTGRGHC